ncbi:MAG: hypothetical protein GX568_08845 [Candidatus Gastranaerophilales bacterium]|nr:hypothetical protein [Candidatus Gastranaerophilales bacterium]
MSKIVLALCNKTPNILKHWKDAGYRCISVDLQFPPGITIMDGIECICADVLTYIPPFGEYEIVFCFPPCDDMAVSGARWFQLKGLKALIRSLQIVERCRDICEQIGAPYFIENPVSTLATYWRKPDYIFNPNEYAGYLENPDQEAYTKKTCLWVGNGFVMPPKKPVNPVLGSKMHKLPPSPDRANLRSETPKGFSKAVFKYNKR